MNNKLFLVMSLVVFSSFNVKSMDRRTSVSASSNTGQSEKLVPRLIKQVSLFDGGESKVSKNVCDQCADCIKKAFLSACLEDGVLVLDSRTPNAYENPQPLPFEEFAQKIKTIKAVRMADGCNDPKLQALVPILSESFNNKKDLFYSKEDGTSMRLIIGDFQAKNASALLTRYQQ